MHIEKVFRSRTDDVSKIVFKRGKLLAEAVDFRSPDRRVLCISTQSGCPVGCSFCGTGRRFVGNLTADDMLAQVRLAGESSAAQFQVMFMSMGEPTLNSRAVCEAARQLAAQGKEVLISTVGASRAGLDRFLELAHTVPLGMQFSIHRREDIPWPKLMPFEELATYGRKFCNLIGKKVKLNFFVGTLPYFLSRCFPPEFFAVTLSEKYDTPCSRGSVPQPSVVDIECSLLKDAGYEFKVFRSAGLDVGGGCGQLQFIQEHLEEHGRRMPWKGDL